MTDLQQWAIRHSVSLEALDELATMFADAHTIAMRRSVTSETDVSALVRLKASQDGDVLWRNNVGVLCDERGIPVRFGLCNDSAKVNELTKSSDLIGIKRVVITQAMVGSVIGQFYAREVKKPGWKYTGTKREKAQLRFIQHVVAMGGDASFVTG